MASERAPGSAPPETAGPSLDGYEREYMQGAGAERYRERLIWRWHWVLLVPSLWTLAWSVFTVLALPGPKALLTSMFVALAAFFALLWVLFAVLRVVVTEREVQVQYGLWGPKIALESVRACRVVDYDWTRFGGWGIKRSSDGTWAYTLMGGGKRVVELTWEDRGELKRAVFSSRDPDAAAEAILRARAALGGGAPRTAVRVGEPPLAQDRDETETGDEGAPREARAKRG